MKFICTQTKSISYTRKKHNHPQENKKAKHDKKFQQIFSQ